MISNLELPHHNSSLTIALQGMERSKKAMRKDVVGALSALGLTVNEQAAVLDYCPAQICNICNENRQRIALSFTDRFLNKHAYTGFSLKTLMAEITSDPDTKHRDVDLDRRDVHHDRATGLIKIWTKMGLVAEDGPGLFKVLQRHLDARLASHGSPEGRMHRMMISAEQCILWKVTMTDHDFMTFLSPLKELSQTPFEAAVGKAEVEMKEREPIAAPLNEVDAHFGIVGGAWELSTSGPYDEHRTKETLASAISAQMEGRLDGRITSIYGPMDEVGIKSLRSQWDSILFDYKKLTLATPSRRGPPPKSKSKSQILTREYVFAFAFCPLEQPRPQTTSAAR